MSVKQYICKTCDAPGEYVRPAPGRLYLDSGTYRHSGADEFAGHDFQPKPQCPKCDSFDYVAYETNWGYGDRCGDCGYDIYFSLGD